MAAPSGIVWGAIKGSYGRIGIYTSISNVDLQSTVTIQVWFWSKYSVKDVNNKFYFNNNATSATTLIGDVSINHTVSSGSGWDTANQTKIGTYTYTYTRTDSTKTISCAAKLTGIDKVSSGGTMSVSTSYTIPALPVYTISFNANGGSGAPTSVTKVHGTNITLPSAKPTRTGYTFLGWNSSSTATTATYSAGGSFTANKTVTLYAIWRANSYTVSFNANGGSGAPANQTKTHGTTLVLSSTVPTRADYVFLGWGVSSTSTIAKYSAGGKYTANASITLYAVWKSTYTKPRITNLKVNRCDAAGVATDEGSYCKLTANWATDKTVTNIEITYIARPDIGASFVETVDVALPDNPGTSGSISEVFGGELIVDLPYDVYIKISDSSGSTTLSTTLHTLAYSIDFLAGGGGVALNKAAVVDGLFDVNLETLIHGALTVDGDMQAHVLRGSDVVTTWGSIDNLLDRFGRKHTNGLTLYESAGIDANTTLDHLILTQTNTPDGVFMYVKTEFYANKTETSNRMQTAFPYKMDGPPYYRYYFNGAWTPWVNMTMNQGGINNPMDKVMINNGATTAIATSTNTNLHTWTVDEDGLYGVSATVKWAGNKNGIRALIARNDTSGNEIAYQRMYSYGASSVVMNVSGYGRATAGQVISVVAWQDSGSNLNVNSFHVQIVKIGL